MLDLSKIDGTYIMIFVSAVLGAFYGMYHFGVMGSSNEYKCISTPFNYHPYPYKENPDVEKQLKEYLKYPGVIDVTGRF